MWVHGSAVRAEEDGYFVTKRHYKDGAVFKTHGTHWFQFPIPTPVIVDDIRASLVKCFVLYEAVSGARISEVQLYDGRKQIKSIPGLSSSGNHSTAVDASNSWTIQPTIQMIFGLGICVKVDFGNPLLGAVPNIRFTAAGADFLTT
jgi:hypothetical protein